MPRIRPAAVAGSFYPAEAEALRDLVQECLVCDPLGPQGRKSVSPSLLGGLVPHAGYVYSGPCAAHFYSTLDPDTRCVVLLGVDHRAHGSKAALSPADYWETPLGKVKVDSDLGKWLEDQIDFVAADEQPHREEHSIEVQLPFLQSVLGEFTFLPLLLSYLSLDECARLGQAVADAHENATACGKKTVIIASSDLSHYLSPKETQRLDRLALEPVLALDPPKLLKVVYEEHISMCGVFPTTAFLFAAKALGASRASLLKHCHSGDAVPMKEVVGYASVAVER